MVRDDPPREDRPLVVPRGGTEEQRPIAGPDGSATALDLRGATTALLRTDLAAGPGQTDAGLRVQAAGTSPPQVVATGGFGEECEGGLRSPALLAHVVTWATRTTANSGSAAICGGRRGNAFHRRGLGRSDGSERTGVLVNAGAGAVPLGDGSLAVLAPRPQTAGGRSHLDCKSDRAAGRNHCELRLRPVPPFREP